MSVRFRVAGILACMAIWLSTAEAQTEVELAVQIDARDPNAGVRVPATLAEGIPVSGIFVYLVNPSGDARKDEESRRALEAAFGIRPGSQFDYMVAEGAIAGVRRLPEVNQAEYRLYQMDALRSVEIALIVKLQAEAPKVPVSNAGLLAGGGLKQFPRLFENRYALVQAIVNPSIGVYVDHNDWLGSPTDFLRSGYDPGSTAGWGESAIEAGAGFVAGGDNLWVHPFGAVTGVFSKNLAPDTYQQSTPYFGSLEKAYGGLLFGRKGSKTTLKLSAGQQKFSLYSNLLFGHVLGSTNGGERGGSYLAPRNAFKMTALGTLQFNRYTITGFFLRPNELPVASTHTQIAGAAAGYNDNRRINASFIFAAVPNSTTQYILPSGQTQTRQGLRAVDPRLRWISAFGVKGLWLEAEWAHEWNVNFPMSANGGGAWAGYAFEGVRWRPAVLYRYGYMSGDNPNRPAYERFDPLLGGVQRAWLQDLTMVKMYNNANLRTSRVEFSVKPKPQLELLLDYYHFTADQLNNRGGQRPLQVLTSRDLGNSITPTVQWSVSKNVFIQALIDTVFPGPGLASNLTNQPAHPWTSFQLAIYMGF
jgi:hypothetical protein